jgi:hypothetical protein
MNVEKCLETIRDMTSLAMQQMLLGISLLGLRIGSALSNPRNRLRKWSTILSRYDDK